MISRQLATSLVLCLAVSSVVLAQAPNPEAAGSVESWVAAAPSLCPAPSTALDTRPAPIFLTSICNATADCWDGSQVSCSASGASAWCEATDSDCDAGDRGYCASSDEGTKRCPQCPCTQPLCSEYDGQTCYPPGIYSPSCNDDLEGGGCGSRCRCEPAPKYGVWVCYGLE